MRAPWRWPVAFAAVALAAAIVPRSAVASEADAFENKIEPVSGDLYAKAGRFEITPTANISFNDPFYNKYLFGLKVGYHFSEFFSLHAFFSGGPSSPTGSTTICSANTTPACQSASNVQLYQLPGKIGMMGGVEVGFSPVYGKLNLVAEQALHFDVSLLGGADYVSFQKALDATSAAAVPAGSTPPNATALGFHVGAGVRLFLARFMALRLELKDYFYSAEIGNQSKNQLQVQAMAELGLSFFLPMGPGPHR